MVKINQNQLNKLIESLNHRMTNIEGDVKIIKNDMGWIKKIGYSSLGIMGTIAVKLLVG